MSEIIEKKYEEIADIPEKVYVGTEIEQEPVAEPEQESPVQPEQLED